MPDVFICFTPYHLLLAETLAKQLKLKSSIVVIADEADLLAHYPQLVDRSLFINCLTLLPIKTTRGSDRGAVYLHNASTIQKYLQDQQFAVPFVFNPLRPESRLITRKSKERPVFVEDGLEAYLDSANPSLLSFSLRAASSLILGLPPTLRTNFIDYLPWQAGFALIPEAVRKPRNRDLSITPISRDVLSSVISRWSESSPRSGPSRVQTLVLLDYPSNGATNPYDSILKAVSLTGTQREQLLVKPHPRDPTSDTVYAELGVQLADRRLPAELFFGQLTNDGHIVTGNSTARLTASVIRPDASLHTFDKESVVKAS
jgi:hypothetical protein